MATVIHLRDVCHRIEVMGEEVFRQILDPAAVEEAILLAADKALRGAPPT
jgi:hypothetical protein